MASQEHEHYNRNIIQLHTQWCTIVSHTILRFTMRRVYECREISQNLAEHNKFLTTKTKFNIYFTYTNYGQAISLCCSIL